MTLGELASFVAGSDSPRLCRRTCPSPDGQDGLFDPGASGWVLFIFRRRGPPTPSPESFSEWTAAYRSRVERDAEGSPRPSDLQRAGACAGYVFARSARAIPFVGPTPCFINVIEAPPGPRLPTDLRAIDRRPHSTVATMNSTRPLLNRERAVLRPLPSNVVHSHYYYRTYLATLTLGCLASQRGSLACRVLVSRAEQRRTVA